MMASARRARTLTTLAAACALAAACGGRGGAAIDAGVVDGDAGLAEAPPPLVDDVPPVPARAPDRLAVMAFENRSGVHVLDWAIAGLPLVIGEKLEVVFGLDPSWGPRVVPAGPVVPATAASVAALAAAQGARWVVSGWVERPDWKLRLHLTLWRVDGGAAVVAGDWEGIGVVEEPHALAGAGLVELAAEVGWRLPADGAARLAEAPSRDHYAFTLLGRGLGRWLGSLGEVERAAAARDLGRAVFIDPDLVVGQRVLGELWAEDPDPKVAKKAAGKFALAVDQRPDYVPALRAAAIGAAAAGQADVARERFAALVKARPWDLDARVGLAGARWQAKDGAGARRELERVVLRRPDDLAAHRMLALIWGSEGDAGRLVAELEIVTRLAPADLSARVDLGAGYAELGRTADAIAVLTEVAAARPTDLATRKRLADLHRKAGDVDRAVAWYGEVAALSASDPRPPFLIGATLYEAGRLDAAKAAFARAAKIAAYTTEASSALGAIAWRQGRLAEAEAIWRKAAGRRPRSAALRHDLALIALAAGRIPTARQQAEGAERLEPGRADTAFLRGVIAWRAGDRDDARASFATALERAPGQAAAQANLEALAGGRAPSALDVAPRLDLPFGDPEAVPRALARFATSLAAATAARVRFERELLAALLALGEGPGKDLVAARTAPRTCPLAAVAPRWAGAKAALAAFVEAGVALEDAHATVALADDLGEVDTLGPVLRAKVAAAREDYRLARLDLRAMEASLTEQLGRELARRRCREDLLAAAAAYPEAYRGLVVAKAPRRAAPPTVPVPPIATFAVDNRSCEVEVSVHVDGAWVGSVQAGDRDSLQAAVGRHTLCLLPEPATARCGDRGTVRDVFVHDGLAITMRCPGEGR
jgi:Flp pilus assembly protein TadD